MFGEPSPSLWVGNYNRTSKERFPLGEEELRREFGKYGDIYSIKAYPPKNCAFVNFWDTEAATRAAEALTGTRINDVKILVNFGKVFLSFSFLFILSLGSFRTSRSHTRR